VDAIAKLLADVADFLWGPPTLIALVGVHLYLTLRLRFIQRYTVKAIRLSLERDSEGEGDVSQFAALATALAATIGTGNIVGVATAVAAGGPGAVFWMWLTGVFGIATKYAEALLAVKYRVTNEEGQMAGGAMYVLERGMGNRALAVAYAVATAICALGIGNAVQANSVAVMANHTLGISPWITGAILMVLTALVILGGIRSIARVCEYLVPFMAIFYTAGCFIVLAMNVDRLPSTLTLIVTSAFSGQAAIGGFVGAGMREAMRYGVARGLFSNESGLGSAGIVAAAAQTRNAVRQALVSSTGTFWDTVVMCAITGIVLVNSGQWSKGLDGAGMSSAAFNDMPVVGPIVLTVGLLTFVFATLIGWSYYGEKACEYLFGTGSVRAYRWAWVVMVMLGSVLPLPLVWSLADITNALMAVPNLVSLVALTHVVVDETRFYLWDDDGRRLDHMAYDEVES
jgi:AGCS family alanine or glycine:cation symporter